ncbi:hypothetical protein OPV22_019246 [Ensete ventricosum]|uniref:Secreted protein n=1 Tax=Ensete ventricosum TaxID=4639 RepID=A0AAV8Q758_ENSVE|nr:hypothetical protein OPV22_019246 [Ensete ventricosum]
MPVAAGSMMLLHLIQRSYGNWKLLSRSSFVLCAALFCLSKLHIWVARFCFHHESFFSLVADEFSAVKVQTWAHYCSKLQKHVVCRISSTKNLDYCLA